VSWSTFPTSRPSLRPTGKLTLCSPHITELPRSHLLTYVLVLPSTWEGPGVAARCRMAHTLFGRQAFNTHLRWSMMPKGHPSARFIYLVRDGRDVCTSYYHHLASMVSQHSHHSTRPTMHRAHAVV
jgi:hypothetical protein